MIEIKHEHKTTEGEFYYEENGVRLAYLSYHMEAGHWLRAEHTVVDPTLGGRGIGKLLLEQCVLFTRKNQYKIVPLCPFVAAQINKTPDWQDVL